MKTLQRVLTISVLVAMAVVSGLSEQQATAETACTLSIGWEPWPPFQSRDEQGKLTGLDIDLVQAVVAHMGCALEFKERPWKRVLVEVETGDLDLALGASKTPEREQWAHFSDPYRQETRVLFVLKGASVRYPLAALDDIITSSMQIGVMRGTYQGQTFERLMKNPDFAAHFQEVAKNEQNYQKLLAGRIDGFIADNVAPIQEMRNLNVLERVEIHPLPIMRDDIFVMLSKKSTTLKMIDDFNQSLAAIKAEGVYDQIFNQYILK